MKKETYLPKQLGMGYVSLRIVSELQFWSVTQRVFLLDLLHLRAINILDLGDMVQLVQKCLGGTAVEVWNFNSSTIFHKFHTFFFKLCACFQKKAHPKFRWPNHFTKNIPVPFVRILKQKTTTQLPSQLHRPNQELLFGNPFSFGGFLGLEHGEAGKVGKGWPSVESMDESQVVWCLQVTNVNLSRGQVHAGHSAGRSVKMVFFWKFILYLLAKRVLWYILLKVRNLRHCLGLV